VVHETLGSISFYVAVEPETRDVVHQGTYFPAHTGRLTNYRIPFQLYFRIVRHAIAVADCGDLRFEVRNGRIRLLDEGAPIVLGPLPPRQHHYREAHKQLALAQELDQVAEIYGCNRGRGIKAVQLELGLSYRTAARRVSSAREAGLLPPVKTPAA
jgi:hypothetical protein